MKINEINYINSTEAIDNIINSIVNGLVEFNDTLELKLEIKLKIRKMKLQIYFENEFNEHLNIIKTKKINNFKTENKKTKFNKQSPSKTKTIKIIHKKESKSQTNKKKQSKIIKNI